MKWEINTGNSNLRGPPTLLQKPHTKINMAFLHLTSPFKDTAQPKILSRVPYTALGLYNSTSCVSEMAYRA